MARSMCWHCQSDVTGEYFCEQCVKVQPVSKNTDYFTCLGIPRRLQIDTSQLESKFYTLSRAFHPDFYQNKTAEEQEISLSNSALLNTAYRTLKDPIQRAEYLVRLEAGAAKDIRTTPPADLFEEILALQENLEEFRAASGAQQSAEIDRLRDQLDADRATLEARQEQMEQRLFVLFDSWDKLQDRAEADEGARREREALLKEMREILSNRTYLRNIITDLTATTEETR
jgi:molecular chaperone HscB